MEAFEVLLADLVDPQWQGNVVGTGGLRGAPAPTAPNPVGALHMDTLKPLVVRVTDHADDLGGVQGVDDELNFAFFESCAAGQPWKKVGMDSHKIWSTLATSKFTAGTPRVLTASGYKTVTSLRIDEIVTGEVFGIAYQDTTQPSPFLAPYIAASNDPVAEALAYQTFVDASTVAIKAVIDPNDPQRILFYANDGYNIMVTYGFLAEVGDAASILGTEDTYFVPYIYSLF